MSALPVSALLATWLDACRRGDAGPDELATAVRGEDPRHLVSGLVNGLVNESGEDDVTELDRLPMLLEGPISLALPAPGDPVGLGGPESFNLAALDAGEAVVVGRVGLVPVEDARTIVWTAHRVEPVPWIDERETAIELRTTLTEVTMRLVDLDVAAWQPDIPDLLMNLRTRPPLPLAPGYDARRIETVERAVLCLEIVQLARAGEGGAVSSYEMDQRRAALADLDRAARRALAGACSGRSG